MMKWIQTKNDQTQAQKYYDHIEPPTPTASPLNGYAISWSQTFIYINLNSIKKNFERDCTISLFIDKLKYIQIKNTDKHIHNSGNANS